MLTKRGVGTTLRCGAVTLTYRAVSHTIEAQIDNASGNRKHLDLTPRQMPTVIQSPTVSKRQRWR